jgi:hypothetical protein
MGLLFLHLHLDCTIARHHGDAACAAARVGVEPISVAKASSFGISLSTS